MAKLTRIVHDHVDVVNGRTQSEINEELKGYFFSEVPNPGYGELDDLNRGVLVISNDTSEPSIYIKNMNNDIVRISGNGSKTVDNYTQAIAEATSETVGRIIYIISDSTIEDKTYHSGPYIVVGEGQLMKLATLNVESSNLEETVSEIEKKLDEVSLEVSKKLNAKVGFSLVEDTEIEKLKTVKENAEENIIEKIVVNGTPLEITDKTVSFNVSEISGSGDGRVSSVELVSEEGKNILRFTFTAAANQEPIDVEFPEMNSEIYTNGNGISIADSEISLKIGGNEKRLSFDKNGGLILTPDFVNEVISFNNSITGLTEDISAINDSISGITESLSGITEDISGITEDITIINQYTVNGYPISQEGGIVLDGKDIVVDELEDTKIEMVSVVSGDTINTAVRKVENTLGATVLAMTASLNDLNSQINWQVKEVSLTSDNKLSITPNTFYILNDAISNIEIIFAEEVLTDNALPAYRYSLLFKTSDEFVGSNIMLPSAINLTNIPLSELESGTIYLLEMQHSFAKWTELYNI